MAWWCVSVDGPGACQLQESDGERRRDLLHLDDCHEKSRALWDWSLVPGNCRRHGNAKQVDVGVCASRAASVMLKYEPRGGGGWMSRAVIFVFFFLKKIIIIK